MMWMGKLKNLGGGGGGGPFSVPLCSSQMPHALARHKIRAFRGERPAS